MLLQLENREQVISGEYNVVKYVVSLLQNELVWGLGGVVEILC